MNKYDVVIIGAGFFGLRLAKYFGERNYSVAIIEQENSSHTRASYNNQARVHNGYHYPRSFPTALSSHNNYGQFISEYNSCINSTSLMLYAIAARNSYVSTSQFKAFCKHVGLPLNRYTGQRHLFNKAMIDEVFQVEEAVFNADCLRNKLLNDIKSLKKIVILYGKKICEVAEKSDGYEIADVDGNKWSGSALFNVTYAGINSILRNSGFEPLDLKLELTEVCLVEPPSSLSKMGITVMDGPFFSLMPFPAKNCHSLTHVRYTPHVAWREKVVQHEPYNYMQQYEKISKFVYMRNDAARYIPALGNVKYLDSLFEMKCIVSRSEDNDGRPIVIKCHQSKPLFMSILGAKIDNIYDLELELQKYLQ